MPPTEVLLVVNKDWYFLSHRLPMAKALADAGYSLTIAAGATGRQAEIASYGYKFTPIPFERGSINPLTGLKSVLALRRLYLNNPHSVVHHVGIQTMLLGSIAAWAARSSRVINTITGLGYLFSSKGYLPRFLRALLYPIFLLAKSPREVRFIFFNRGDRDLFIRKRFARAQHCVLVPGSGVDITRFTPAAEPAGAITILCCSRLLWDKGIGELVAAVSNLRGRGHQIVLRIAGARDSSNRAAIPESQLNDWVNSGAIVWSGFENDIPALLRDAHIAVLPSYGEGLPLFLLEAAAAGRPVVATDIAGCREVVEHEVNGLLVPTRDTAALEGALGRLVSSPELRRELGARNRMIAEQRFSTEKVGAVVVELYRSLEHGAM